MRLAAILSLTTAIIYILLQSLQPVFYMHLYPDVFVFHDRATFFWEHLSLRLLGHNEYQPGAIVFFILVGLSFILDSSLETFKWGLFVANIGLIVLLAFILDKMKKTAGIILLSLLLIFLGPVLLFRFDFLVILLLTLVFYFWESGRFGTAMAILPLGVLVKVYPIIFLPYLLWLAFRKSGLSHSIYLFSIFSSTLISYFLIYILVFQISFIDTFVSYNFHNLKSVSTESVWASFIYFFNFVTVGTLPSMESAYGINAITREELYPSIQFYNYFWILPVGILYLFYFLRNEVWDKIDYKFLIFLLLVFLIFSKVLSNQYLAWFLLMLPLIDMKTLLQRKWIITTFLIFLTTFLHTYIYPLNYPEWLAMLVDKSMNPLLFWVMIIANFLLVLIAVRIGQDVFKNKE